ncbi:MAG: hypothetical protein AAGA18_15370 [Verrucomicrobiota bacterium]
MRVISILAILFASTYANCSAHSDCITESEALAFLIEDFFLRVDSISQPFDFGQELMLAELKSEGFFDKQLFSNGQISDYSIPHIDSVDLFLNEGLYSEQKLIELKSLNNTYNMLKGSFLEETGVALPEFVNRVSEFNKKLALDKSMYLEIHKAVETENNCYFQFSFKTKKQNELIRIINIYVLYDRQKASYSWYISSI